MVTDPERRAHEMKRELEELVEFISPELIKVLASAAQDDHASASAAADADAFLKARNIPSPPPGTGISFLRAYPGAPPDLRCGDGSLQVCEMGRRGRFASPP